MDNIAPTTHLHLIDDITWNFSFQRHFLFFLQHYIRHDAASLVFPYIRGPSFPPSTSSGLTFRRFALSVMFIVYGVDDEVADDEILLRRTAFVRAGWPPVSE